MTQEREKEMPKEINGRKLKEGITKEEIERLEKYGVIEFKSAGATRKR